MTEMIGWASSLILLATLIKQVYKQWSDGTSEGISKWLFVGQLAASVGFTDLQLSRRAVGVHGDERIADGEQHVGICLYFYFRNRQSREDQLKSVAVSYDHFGAFVDPLYRTLKDLDIPLPTALRRCR